MSEDYKVWIILRVIGLGILVWVVIDYWYKEIYKDRY